MFDPVRIADDACAEGHLDADPIHQVLLTIGEQTATGRLSIGDAAGANHMFFMQGRPVGVQLAEHLHPLGQLLLELGRVDGSLFLKAQRLIAEGGRLPGQVYKELGVVDEAALKDTLAIQARRKAEHFCRLGSRPFTFCKGLMYLSGFTSTPLDPHGVIYLAIRQQMGEQAREAWLESARGEQVRVVVPGNLFDPNKPADHSGLPSPLASYGFGAPEERLLQRVLASWESVVDLAETGTLPRDEMAVLLRYLEVIGRLQRRPTPPPPPVELVAALGEPTGETLEPMSADEFALLEATAPEQPSLPGALPRLAPSSPPRATSPAVSALSARPLELAAAPLTEPTSDDVFSKPARATLRAPVAVAAFDDLGAGHAVEPDAVTDPRRPAAQHAPQPAPQHAPRRGPHGADVFAESSSSDVFAGPAPAGAPNPALHEPTPQVPPPPIDEPVPVVKKKKVKRSEPLPSEVSAVTVSETRREKTMVALLPSIVIDDD